MKHQQLTAIDLFCGCGGISLGLEMSGIQVIAGLDNEKKYLCSFSRNFPFAQSISADLSQFEAASLQTATGVKQGELFLLAGGPPCQGFSKNVPRRERFLEDPRNLLISSFLDYCEILRPLWILFENVAEMKNGFEQSYTEEITNSLSKAGYQVSHSILNAADYGVPQRRRRAFFVANRLGIDFQFPQPTHQIKGEANLFALPKRLTVWDAISDLPSLGHGQGETLCAYNGAPCNEFQRRMRAGKATVSNHIARQLQPKQFARLEALLPGRGLKDLPPHLQTKGGYSGAYGRLTKEMIAPTITRWVFHPGSGRWGHPVDIRTLTMREVARLQSFPDSYELVGSFNDQAGQLGNAVPPLLIHQIADQILHQTSSKRDNNSINCSKFNLRDGAGMSKVMA